MILVLDVNLWVATQTRSQSCILESFGVSGLATHPSQLKTSEQAHSPRGEGKHHLHNACLQTDRKPLEEAPEETAAKCGNSVQHYSFPDTGIDFQMEYKKKRNFNLSQTLELMSSCFSLSPHNATDVPPGSLSASTSHECVEKSQFTENRDVLRFSAQLHTDSLFLFILS